MRKERVWESERDPGRFARGRVGGGPGKQRKNFSVGKGDCDWPGCVGVSGGWSRRERCGHCVRDLSRFNGRDEQSLKTKIFSGYSKSRYTDNDHTYEVTLFSLFFLHD